MCQLVFCDSSSISSPAIHPIAALRDSVGIPRSQANLEDEPLLQQINAHLQRLTPDQKAALAVAALYEATEPPEVFLDYELHGFGWFFECVEAVLQLSYSGKLALTRAIAEELAVCHQIARAAK